MTDFDVNDDKCLAEWLNIHDPRTRDDDGCYEPANHYLSAPDPDSDYRVLRAVRWKARENPAIEMCFIRKLGDLLYGDALAYEPGIYARAAFAVMKEGE